jgi:hypothetical protein
VIKVASESGSVVTKNDIDVSHRVGKKIDSSKHRDIVVRFNSFKAKTSFLQGRRKLRENKSSYYINEQLSSSRRELAFQCRHLKRDKSSPIVDTWSFNGNIYIRLQAKKSDQKGPSFRINCLDDLIKFGYTPSLPDNDNMY